MLIYHKRASDFVIEQRLRERLQREGGQRKRQELRWSNTEVQVSAMVYPFSHFNMFPLHGKK